MGFPGFCCFFWFSTTFSRVYPPSENAEEAFEAGSHLRADRFGLIRCLGFRLKKGDFLGFCLVFSKGFWSFSGDFLRFFQVLSSVF